MWPSDRKCIFCGKIVCFLDAMINYMVFFLNIYANYDGLFFPIYFKA